MVLVTLLYARRERWQGLHSHLLLLLLLLLLLVLLLLHLLLLQSRQLGLQHLVLGFDSRSIQMVNAMEILVALLAGITVYKAFYSLMNDTIFPAMDRMRERREKRSALVTCPCGRHHSV